MRGRIPHLIDRAKFDHFAEIHHQHAVGDVADDVEVVADEEIGQAEFALEIGQQIEHLRLDRFVERRDRFVEDHQSRRQRQRARNVDTLALPAGNFVRIAAGKILRPQAHLAEQLTRQRARDAPSAMPCTLGPKAIDSSIVSRGLSEA